MIVATTGIEAVIDDPELRMAGASQKEAAQKQANDCQSQHPVLPTQEPQTGEPESERGEECRDTNEAIFESDFSHVSSRITDKFTGGGLGRHPF